MHELPTLLTKTQPEKLRNTGDTVSEAAAFWERGTSIKTLLAKELSTQAAVNQPIALRFLDGWKDLEVQASSSCG